MLLQQSKATSTHTFLETGESIRSRTRLTKNDCLILGALLQAMDDTHCCCISLSRLREQTGLPSATLCTRLSSLCANRVIEKHVDISINGGFLTNCYQLFHIEEIKMLLNSGEEK